MNDAYRSVIDVEVRFLHTLAMIALRIGEAKEAFFEKVAMHYQTTGYFRLGRY